MRRRGTETSFLSLVRDLNTGIKPDQERSLAGRFFSVSLKLARAASRHQRELRSREAMPFKRGVVVGDTRTDPSHPPLADVLLPADHAFWRRWHPPFGPDCRCGALPMTRSQLERFGRSPTSPETLATIESRLHDDWPMEFIPLLDFRSAAEPSREPAREPRLTTGQFAEVMKLFGSANDQPQ